MNLLHILQGTETGIANELGTILAGVMALSLFVLMPVYYIFQARRKYHPRKLAAPYLKEVQKLSYYQKLNPNLKRHFERRVQKFINQKRFVPRAKNWQLSPEMKAKIAASAVELTFGFKDFRFEHFERILVYPDDYYSNISKRYHRGEVNPRGFIVLSWKAFEEGYADPNDGINLGIHEMAHALKLENTILNKDYGFIEDQDLLRLEMTYDRFKSGQSPLEGFFRNYGKANVHEFFAVSCENFLERSQEFKEKDPDYYNLMVQILNQDPLQLEQSKLGSKHQARAQEGPVIRY